MKIAPDFVPNVPSYTIDEFCSAERISRPTYFKMKKLGHGPDELEIPGLVGIIRITHSARLAWQERMRRMPKSAGPQTRKSRALHASEFSVASPEHVSKGKHMRE